MTPRRILLMDADKAHAKAQCQMLALHGFEVEHEAEMRRALTRMLFEPFGLILISVPEPIVRDYALCSSMRQYTSAPIIMLCDAGQEKHVAQCKEAGADGVLLAPHTEDRMLWEIYYVIGKCATQKPFAAQSYIDNQLAGQEPAKECEAAPATLHTVKIAKVAWILLRVTAKTFFLYPVYKTLFARRHRRRAVPLLGS